MCEGSVASAECRLPSSEEELLVYCETPLRAAIRCAECEGKGVFRSVIGNSAPTICSACAGDGWLGIDPLLPTSCQAGSAGKIAVMSARYAQGKPLFQVGDRDLRDVIPQCGPMEPEQPATGFGSAVGSDFADDAETWDDEEELVASAA